MFGRAATLRANSGSVGAPPPHKLATAELTLSTRGLFFYLRREAEALGLAGPPEPRDKTETKIWRQRQETGDRRRETETKTRASPAHSPSDWNYLKPGLETPFETALGDETTLKNPSHLPKAPLLMPETPGALQHQRPQIRLAVAPARAPPKTPRDFKAEAEDVKARPRHIPGVPPVPQLSSASQSGADQFHFPGRV